MITNKHCLPEAFVNFARNDKYTKGDSDISVTQLIDSPRVLLMREKHKEDLSVDASNKAHAGAFHIPKPSPAIRLIPAKICGEAFINKEMIKVFKMMRLFGIIKVINDPEYYHKKWDYLDSIKKM